MSEILEALKKASKSWEEAKKIADKEIKPRKSILETANKIEESILEKSGIAFPVNLSRNNEAAHYSPKSDSTETFQENDMIKVDIGTQVNGHIVDGAYTINLGAPYEDLVEASKEALKKALEYILQNKSESILGEIGRIIEETIKKYDGYKPIYNLTGHSMTKNNLHAGKSIPNYKTNNQTKLGTGLFAIEPFATNGQGLIKDGNFCSIYSYLEGQTRLPSARVLVDDAQKYNNLPFSERWIGKYIPSFEKKMALHNLVQMKVFKPHPVLVEKNGAYISQHEKTVYIDEKNKVYIFPDIEY